MAQESQQSQQSKRSYSLSYRRGNELLTKHFELDGNLGAAIKRGREHCEIFAPRGYRFIIVRPLIVDLALQESHYLDNPIQFDTDNESFA